MLSAPSGGGKNTIAAALMRICPFLEKSRSVTTRPLRGSEQAGRDYEFVSPAEFDRMEKAGEFAESARVHGHAYGTPKRFLEEACSMGKCPLLVIDVQGGVAIKKHEPAAVLFFLMPHSLEEIERRLRERGTESEEQIGLRLANARQEIRAALDYDYLILNREVDLAARQICEMLVTHHSLQKT